jgi:Secretion system C-terminal sorting domain/Matrixin
MRKITLLLLGALAVFFVYFQTEDNTPIISSGLDAAEEKTTSLSKEEALKVFKPNINKSLKKAIEWAQAHPEDFANRPATCFAPDTEQAYIENFYNTQNAIENSLGLPQNEFNLGNRWSTTATDGGGLNQGDITTLTWSYVPDGTTIGNSGCQLPDQGTFSSNFIAFFNGIYGPPTVPGDYTTAPWHTIFVNMFNSWSDTSGLVFVYEPNDDGADNVSNSGIVGIRGDMRISGHRLDGNSGVLACNYFPNGGDMIIDTDDNFFSNNPGTGTINVLTHEIGHGIGIRHVCPVNTTKLMEPFVTTAFLGPQEDDILAANRSYGDPDGNNDTAANAVPLGANAVPTSYTRTQRSIDDDTDTDFYSFTVNQPAVFSGTLTPTGTTYLEGVQNPNGSCSPGSNFNALTLANLMFDVIDTDGVTVLATGAGNNAGVAETVNNISLPAAGTYFMRISQEGTPTNNVQMYDLDLSLTAPANLAPTATAPSAPMVVEDDVNVPLANDIQISDGDGDNQTVTFTITGGTLTVGAAGIAFGGGGNGSANFTASGTLANINIALDAATFTPTPNLNGVNAGTIAFTSNDGTANSNTASVTFDIAAVNDDPTYSNLPTDITVIENTPSNVDISAGFFEDIDSDTDAVTVTITAGVGTLTGIPGGGVIISGAGNVLVLTGTESAIDTFLNDPTNVQYTGPPGLSGDDATTLTITANDGGNNGAGGGNTITMGVVNVDIIFCNLTITCPPDLTIECDEDSTPANTGSATATHACPGPITITFSDNVVNGTGSNSVITRTWTATNIFGNTTTCDQIITVEDTTPPVASCAAPFSVQLDASGNASITAAQVDDNTTDNCGTVTLSIAPTSFTCADVGDNTVTLITTDENGNSSTCTTTVTVEDNEVPIASCQDITVQLDPSGNVSITAGQVDSGSSDACGVASVTVSPNTFDCSNTGNNTVTLTVTDVNGNIATCTATVTVEDTTAPNAICQDITVQLDAAGNASITPAQIDGGSSDSCDITTLSATPDTFTCNDVGANDVILSLTDANGNTSTCVAIVTVEDTVAPMAVCQDITVQLDNTGNASIVAANVDGGSTDACGIASLSVDIDSFTCANIGSNNVTLTVTDVNGNTSNCVAVVTVEDNNVLPVPNCQNLTAILNENGMVTIQPEDVLTNTIDGCNLTTTLDINTFTCNDIGTSVTVTVTVADGNGNSNSCMAQVNIIDNIPPTFDPATLPGDQVREADVNGEYVLEDFAAAIGVTDNCGIAGQSITLSQNPIPGTTLVAGIYNISLTAADDFGNSVNHLFELEVTEEVVLGVNENKFDLSSLSLFPNPANTYVLISNPEEIDFKSVNIYDISGRLVHNAEVSKENGDLRIDISRLASASYFVMITTETGQVTMQLVKK